MRPIKIWRYKDAPKKYLLVKELDDADWVTFIPKEYGENYPVLLEQLSSCGSVVFETEDGRIIISTHA